MSLSHREAYNKALDEAYQRIEAKEAIEKEHLEARLFVESELVPALKEAEGKARDKVGK